MACECGHLEYDHLVRRAYSVFSCAVVGCTCRDYVAALSDDETATDIALLLPFDGPAS